jgi:hypothetical protein
MGWFGVKSSHQKEVAAVTRIAANLCEITTRPPIDSKREALIRAAHVPTMVLRFQLPDSLFRYMTFCLTTVITGCARSMKNADAVLNECAHNLDRMIDTPFAAEMFGAGPLDRQKVANDGAAYLQDFLDRWSAYVEISKGGNGQAATSLVCSMLRDTESLAPAAEGEGPRLWPLAVYVEQSLDKFDRYFIELSR